MKDNIRNRIIVTFISILLGLVIGYGLNLGWAIFSGLFLGWFDSGPDWYVSIQGYLHHGIMIAAIVFCIAISNIYLFTKKRE